MANLTKIMQQNAESPFSIRPYARAIRNIYGKYTGPHVFGGQIFPERLYADIGRKRYRPTIRQSLEIAKDIKPFMPTPELRFIGEGSESDVFSLGNKHVIKFTDHPAPRTGWTPPLLSTEDLKGVEGILQPEYHKTFPDFNVSVFPKARTGSEGSWTVSEYGVEKMKASLLAQGVGWTDAVQRNMGLVKGKPVVVDTGYMYRRVAENITKSAHLAPARKAVIEGLAEGGVAKVIRKALTYFGSGWSPSTSAEILSGVPGIYHVYRGKTEKNLFFRGKEKLAGIYTTPEADYAIGYSSADNPFSGAGGAFQLSIKTDKPLKLETKEAENIIEEFNRTNPISKNEFGEIEDASFSKYYVTNEARDFLKKKGYDSIISTERASMKEYGSDKLRTILIGLDTEKITVHGIAGRSDYIPNMDLINAGKKAFKETETITKAIMDTGEGSAIVQAGTSTIKSVLKAGSRVIKNML